MRCKTCHYSLANLTGPPHRCPECGTPFDPSDAQTFDAVMANFARRRDRKANLFGWLLVAFLLIALILLMLAALVFSRGIFWV